MQTFIVGGRYRDLAATRKSPEAGPEDQFLGWLNIDGRGMQAFGGIRWLGNPTRILVLVTSKHVGNLERPWDDVVLPERNALLYWGDARWGQAGTPRGNKKLQSAWDFIRTAPRQDHPLVLYFCREDRGWVTFRGLGVLADLCNQAFLDTSTGAWVENKLAQVRLFSSVSVAVEWLRGWGSSNSFRDIPGAPSEYLEWVSNPPATWQAPVGAAELEELLLRKSRAAIREARHGLRPERPRGVLKPSPLPATVEIYSRDAAVRAWVLERAGGACELCGERAPFNGTDGEPFLEVHHVVRIAEGGPDTVDNTVALCPNCHRRLHYSPDRSQKSALLYAQISELAKPQPT